MGEGEEGGGKGRKEGSKVEGRYLSHVTIIVEGSEVVQHFEGSHEGLGSRGIHEIEVHEIINTQLLQVEYYRAQIGSENFWVRVWLQILHING